MRSVMMVLVMGAAGCISTNTPGQVSAYVDVVSEARALVTAHAQAVGNATTVEEAEALEASYATSWADMHERMQQHMDDLGGCTMHGDGMSMMEDAGMTMGDMDDAVRDHMQAHEAHEGVAACQSDEQTHLEWMMDDLNQMGDHGDHWLDQGMSCPMM